jgi:hypothetical protein
MRIIIDVHEAIISPFGYPSVTWGAEIDNTQSVTTVEAQTSILDKRSPEALEALLWIDPDNWNIRKKSFVVPSGEQTVRGLERLDYASGYNPFQYDQQNQAVLRTDEDSDERDASPLLGGTIASNVTEGHVIAFDEEREHLIGADDAFRQWLYDGTYLGGGWRYFNGMSPQDLALAVDRRFLFVAGTPVDETKASLLKLDYREPRKELARARVSYGVRTVVVDPYRDVLFTAENRARYLRRRSITDLSVEAQRDFGSSGTIYGIDFDPVNQMVYFAADHVSGLRRINYDLEAASSEQVVSGNARYPQTIVDTKRGLPPDLSIQSTRIDGEAEEVGVSLSVLDVSDFEAYQIRQSATKGGVYTVAEIEGRDAGETPTLKTGMDPGTTRFYDARVRRSDGTFSAPVGPRRVVYVGATNKLTQNALWRDPSADRYDLSLSTKASAKAVVDLQAGDSGIIMEAGAYGNGLALFTDGSTLYFACGDGGDTGSDANTAWIETPMPTGQNVVIEWSANVASDFAQLLVNGEYVGSDSFDESEIAGNNAGGIVGTQNSLREVPSGVRTNGFDGTVHKARIYNDQIVLTPPSLDVVDVGTNRIALRAVPNGNLQPGEYKFYRKTPSESSFQQVGTVTASGAEMFEDTSLDEGKEYQYKVVGVESGTDSPKSAVVTPTTRVTYRLDTVWTKVPGDARGYVAMLDLSLMPDAFWQKVSASGDEIRVRSRSGETAPRDLESFDAAARTGILHTRVDVFGDRAAPIYIDLEGSGAPAPSDPNGRNAVWTDYEAVWHCGEDLEQGPLIDATGNGNDAPSRGSMTSGDSVAGQVARATELDGSDDYLPIENLVLTPSYAQFGVMGWFRATEADGNMFTFDRNEYFRAEMGGTQQAGSGYFGVSVEAGGTTYDDINSAERKDDGAWHHFDLRVSETRSAASLRVDGTETANRSISGPLGQSSTDRYGFFGVNSEADSFDGANSGGHYGGAVDEMRLAFRAFSDAYRQATYNNQSDPLSFFFRYEGGQVVPALAGKTLSGTVDNEVTVRQPAPAAATVRVFRSTSQGGSYSKIAEVSDPSLAETITDPDVTSGTTYYYKAAVVDETGSEGTRSAAISITAQT